MRPTFIASGLRAKKKNHAQQPAKKIWATPKAYVFHEAFVPNNLKRGNRDGRRHRIAAKGRSVGSNGKVVHDLVARQHRRDREHAAAQRLAQDQHVRLDRVVVAGEEFAGSSKSLCVEFRGQTEEQGRRRCQPRAPSSKLTNKKKKKNHHTHALEYQPHGCRQLAPSGFRRP